MLNNNAYRENIYNEYEEDNDNNLLQDDIIYEINDTTIDDQELVNDDDICKVADDISEKTCSSMENEFENLLFDYTIVIDCLSSGRYQRSESEIAILSSLLRSIPDFMCVSASELEYICQAARLISIDYADELIVRKCSVLSEWYLCLEGSLRKVDYDTNLLGPGVSIGTDLWSGEILISDYDLYSNSNVCKLLAIGVEDLKPFSKLNNLMIKTSDDDKSVIAVYEAYTDSSANDETCTYVLTKGTQNILISALFTNPKWVSADYVEDFFLTHKLFLNSTVNIRNEIANDIYHDNEFAKDKFDVLIRWLSQSFAEFERNLEKLLFIDDIISILKKQNNNGCLYTLYECCSNWSNIRQVKEKISLKEKIVSVKSDYQTIFYFHQINDRNSGLRDGDVLMELEGRSNVSITMEMIESLSSECRPIVMYVKNDLLGYHEHVLKDIAMDSVSIDSGESVTRYVRSSSHDSNCTSLMSPGRNIRQHKRPALLPNLFTTFQSGSIGKFFKYSKQYTNHLKRRRGPEPLIAFPQGSYRNSEATSRIENIQYGNKELTASTMSITRFSKHLKSKRRRRSIGSNADLIKSFEDLDLSELNSPIDCKFPFRIHLKDIFINPNFNSTTKSDLQYFHVMILPSTAVTEVIVRTLLKLNLNSASSTSFYLVEVRIDEDSGMIHEKILHPDTINLMDRIKEHSRYYLKHRSFVAESLLQQSEAEKMREDYRSPCILKMSINVLAVRLFLRSYRLLCQILPEDLVNYVSGNKSTLTYQKRENKSQHGMFEYMHLSDFYKNWVITEVCSIGNDISERASTIQYFIHLALKAIYIGHIDLFFSLISGLESIDVSRLTLSWEKVPKRDKKLLQNLKTTLDVSGNMRNLRIVHQRMTSPIIPVTAMVIKDLTMLEETQSTYVSGTINGLHVNHDLVNFDKMRKMSRLARIFVNSCCSCGEDKSRPVKKHSTLCKMKWENKDRLEKFLQCRLENQSDSHFPKESSHSLTEKRHRKFSFSNISIQSSSSESLSGSVSSLKSGEEKSTYQIFEQRMMIMKIERYLKTLEERVVIDSHQLSNMSLSCEQSLHDEGMHETIPRNPLKIPKVKDSYSGNTKLHNGVEKTSERRY